MRIGDLHPLQQTLDTAIFAPAPMQSIEHNIRLHPLQLCNEICARINLNNPIARLPQGGGTFLACR